jgi:hypothetical protein
MVARKKQFGLSAAEIAERRKNIGHFRKWSAIIKKRRVTAKKGESPPISTGDDPLLKRLRRNWIATEPTVEGED